MLYRNIPALLFAFVLASSCALRNMSTGLTKYQQAVLRYEAQDYYKASLLFEEASSYMQGARESASVHFFQAYCDFYQKKYAQSAERFQDFYETFPGDPRVEESMYMQGHSLYLQSPDVRLDATITEEAVSVLRSYLDRYPKGIYAERVSIQLGRLCNKLAIKAFNNAKLYYQLAHYRAAVVSLANFFKDFPTSSYNEEAAYLKADAQYRYAQNTKHPDQQDQLAIALSYCKAFLDNYPSSSYTLVVESLCKKISATSKPQKAAKR
ncbi:MAG: outer membrane protein assembly factor BamD [Bacteroidota bacterium]